VRAARLLLVVAAGLLLLVAGMMSATLLDFEPGAWVAFGVVVVFVGARTVGWLGLWPGDWDFDGD
jgi:hypothetical protein